MIRYADENSTTMRHLKFSIIYTFFLLYWGDCLIRHHTHTTTDRDKKETLPLLVVVKNMFKNLSFVSTELSDKNIISTHPNNTLLYIIIPTCFMLVIFVIIALVCIFVDILEN